MIDLRFKELPSQIECDGIFYDIDTDFRKWIEFERILREKHGAWHGIFKGDVPNSDDWVESAIEFLLSRNATPRPSGSGSDRAFDYVLDGDYIVAAFQQAYGIDLTSVDHMHWHRFNALMNGLPEDVKLSKIIEYRLWKNSKKKPEERMRELKSIWALPIGEATPHDDEVIQLAEEFFG